MAHPYVNYLPPTQSLPGHAPLPGHPPPLPSTHQPYVSAAPNTPMVPMSGYYPPPGYSHVQYVQSFQYTVPPHGAYPAYLGAMPLHSGTSPFPFPHFNGSTAPLPGAPPPPKAITNDATVPLHVRTDFNSSAVTLSNLVREKQPSVDNSIDLKGIDRQSHVAGKCLPLVASLSVVNSSMKGISPFVPGQPIPKEYSGNNGV